MQWICARRDAASCQITLTICSPCDRELSPMTLTFEYDRDTVKMNHHAQYLSQDFF